MPKGFSDREKDVIRQQLVQAGDTQFSTYGLKKTSVEDLAEAAKISKGAFYLFYASKEELFLDVVAQAEGRFRGEMLAALDQPGPTPRARLLAAFRVGFGLLKTTPLLRFSTSSDFEVLLRRVPPEKLRAHLSSDALFVRDLIARAAANGIPVVVPPDQVSGLMYPLVLAALHAADFGQGGAQANMDILLELVAAYCLGEVALAAVPVTESGAV